MRYKLAAATLATGLVAGGAITAVAVTEPADNGKIYACYHTTKGKVRFVDHHQACPNDNWDKVAWNQRGKRGKRGPSSAKGLVYETTEPAEIEIDADRNQVVVTQECSGEGTSIGANTTVRDLAHVSLLRSRKVDDGWELLVRYETADLVQSVGLTTLCIG